MSTPELQPSFEIAVVLDGDDDAQTQTGNAHFALDSACAKMVDDGLIRSYEITYRDADGLELIPSETNEP
jgi:hypothetical protein